VRFLLDEAIQHRLADHLAEAGPDATHVVRIGLAGASDKKVLARTAAEDRILITTDTDFPTPLALSGDAIPSVILLRGVSDSIQDRLAAILTALPSNPRQIRTAIDLAAEHREQIESRIHRAEAAPAASVHPGRRLGGRHRRPLGPGASRALPRGTSAGVSSPVTCAPATLAADVADSPRDGGRQRERSSSPRR